MISTDTLRATAVWHTQDSGKSFTMLFFAARVIRESAMQNPTLVVLTGRNDLDDDDQLFVPGDFHYRSVSAGLRQCPKIQKRL